MHRDANCEVSGVDCWISIYPLCPRPCQRLAHKLHEVLQFDPPLPNAQVNAAPSSAAPPKFSTSPWLYLTHLITPYTKREKEAWARSQGFRSKGSGYSHEQATRPQTLGYSLTDSPVGLLAWIYEKLVEWTDGYPWTDDEGTPRPLGLSFHHVLIDSG